MKWLPRLTIDRGALWGDEHGEGTGCGITLYWGPFILSCAAYRRDA